MQQLVKKQWTALLEPAQLRDKILSQIPDDPRKTKQIASNLQLCVGERTEIASNVRTDDGMTNGAGNIVKKIQLNHKDKPSGIIWVQFDHPDVGEKTRHENRNLYVQGIESTWTPIKPVTTQFGVGRNQTVQVVRKQFPDLLQLRQYIDHKVTLSKKLL